VGKPYTHRGTKRPKRRSPPASDQLDVMAEVRDILLMILLMQACPSCLGTGATPDGKELDGRPRYARCSCRRRAVEFLADFDDSGIDEEDGSDSAQGSHQASGIVCHCGRELEGVGGRLRHVEDGTERCR